jgi:xanthine dehydrogenase accessory factor
MTPEIFVRLMAARAAKEPVVLATNIPDGRQYVLPDPAAPAALRQAAEVKLPAPVLQEIDGEKWFLHPHAPPPRLAIIGAVHVAQALAQIAGMSGFNVTVIDPRRGFATEERFLNIALDHAWPDEALQNFLPDSETAIVALTHDPKLDDPALDIALCSPCFYIGALGSRKTHAARCARLAALGHDAATLARIHGPVGLAIGAVTAAEIALSIMAEIIAVRHAAPLALRGPQQ